MIHFIMSGHYSTSSCVCVSAKCAQGKNYTHLCLSQFARDGHSSAQTVKWCRLLLCPWRALKKTNFIDLTVGIKCHSCGLIFSEDCAEVNEFKLFGQWQLFVLPSRPSSSFKSPLRWISVVILGRDNLFAWAVTSISSEHSLNFREDRQS